MTISPNYRVRLFLSVDLSNSTAYKLGAGKDGSSGVSDAHKPQWLTVTTKFYSDFSLDFIRIFERDRSSSEITCPFKPQVWKTIGDEIVYVMTVDSVNITSICIKAFLKALFNQRGAFQAKSIPLDVKGAAWVAAFPAQNTTLNLKDLSSDSLLYDPEFENRADEKPVEFDFLGTAIDAGFRVAKLATPEKMPVTIELASILSSAAIRRQFSEHFIYDGRHKLKGVLGDRPYPVVFIDTERSETRRKANDRESALTGQENAGSQQIWDFLEAFMEDEEIELPFFEDDKDFSSMPKSYDLYRAQQPQSQRNIQSEDASRREAQLAETGPDDVADSISLPDNVMSQLGIGLAEAPLVELQGAGAENHE